MRDRFSHSIFAYIYGSYIMQHNEDVYEKMRELRDEAVAANQSKLTFIAKMRYNHAGITLVITLVITCVYAR